ncbi:MAG: enoyl-CoA hydratase/isomerase family protein [Deltaproteobacteria bacterium]|nr:enoyl-CoA hydratase/isomerase family protein [Deltaproteobacteria bacterium]
MEKKQLVKEVVENIAILKINRPDQANALNRDLFLGLKAELDNLGRDPGIRVVIITGEGEKEDSVVVCQTITAMKRKTGSISPLVLLKPSSGTLS